MSNQFWQAKIWGLLHDPALKALHNNYGRGGNSFWQDLAVMKDWKDNSWNPEDNNARSALRHIHDADYITSASDRSALGSLSEGIDYETDGLEISHLLSGEKLNFKLEDSIHHELLALLPKQRAEHLKTVEADLIPDVIKQSTNPQLVFWWFWRCFPQAACDRFNDQSLLLMPAETRIPDGSIWNHTSLTAAMAGTLAGYDLTTEEIERWTNGKKESRPYLATFSFSPVQELIKASRKMRDFWAGSWILHYLSAKVSWALACKYGPDSLIYPSLYAQPLIDYWLLHETKWGDLELEEFRKLIPDPIDRSLLTAGFPNVLVVLLPEAKVEAAMQMAKQTLMDEWQKLGKLSLEEIRKLCPNWMPGLTEASETWKGWLESQWQTYWSAYPIGDPELDLRSSEIYKSAEGVRDEWTAKQNMLYNLSGREALFLDDEREFLRKAGKLRQARQNRYPFNANVGSWWAYVFDQVRLGLTSVKSARDWQLPTAFGVRSTVSGIGSALHPNRKMSEQSIKENWERQAGLFDGSEMLNATETLKRSLHKVLPRIFPALTKRQERIDATYPDLTAGVAGYLKVSREKQDRDGAKAILNYQDACFAVLKIEDPNETKQKNLRRSVRRVIQTMSGKWGIPYADEPLISSDRPREKYHPRLLNTGWLLEDIEFQSNAEKVDLRKRFDQILSEYYPSNNPADWYVMAAGDGDSMSEWLKGTKMAAYRNYVPDKLVAKVRESGNKERENKELQNLEKEVAELFEKFLEQDKRMGPSTHSALSRALLDFSNQLVPFLTEQRYAGRLIYGGGDDVLAYTNLWEWDQWLWDIRQCFKGKADPSDQFDNSGDYWRWKDTDRVPNNLSARPLFTMGSTATISFGIVIAHHSVPLAIALESMWAAEAEAKEHEYIKHHRDSDGKQCYEKKDAVQVRVIYGNGNTLKATCKFDTFHLWQKLLSMPNLEPALFEQAAVVWEQHPVPIPDAIEPWCVAFCDRREKLTDNKDEFLKALSEFLINLWNTTEKKPLDLEVQNWLKLAAFMLRKRDIKIGE